MKKREGRKVAALHEKRKRARKGTTVDGATSARTEKKRCARGAGGTGCSSNSSSSNGGGDGGSGIYYSAE